MSGDNERGSGSVAAMAARPLGEYLAAVADEAPTPGGGSVTAVVAALAAALGEMVCHLSPGNDAAAGAALRDAERALAGMRVDFLAFAAGDEAAYAAYVAARSLPKSDAAEQAARKDAMGRALLASTEGPLAVAGRCLDALAALEPVARFGKPALRADTIGAALLAEAALQSALATARGNLGGLPAPERGRFGACADDLERRGDAARAALMRILDGAAASG